MKSVITLQRCLMYTYRNWSAPIHPRWRVPLLPIFNSVWSALMTTGPRWIIIQLFSEAISTQWLPSHGRGGRGGKNVRVADFMTSQHGINRGSFISGHSGYNQQIEHMWCDVFNGCILLYYCLFHHMEENGILHPDRDVHIFCLHYICLPYIDNSLAQFWSAWNNCPLSSVAQLSPSQLWIYRWLTPQPYWTCITVVMLHYYGNKFNVVIPFYRTQSM